MDHVKEFQKVFSKLTMRHSHYQVFSDFIHMAAISLAQSVYRSDELEQEYLDIIGRYDHGEERLVFPELMAIVVKALDEANGFRDFLGEVFGASELGNKHIGQFFTPYDVSLLLAELNAQGIENHKGIVTLSEPACGSGGMVLAFCQAAQRKGFNYQQRLFASCVDISPNAFYMAYIQLSLVSVPAEIILGNTLTMEFSKTWVTPMYVWSGMEQKLKVHCEEKKEISLPVIGEQLDLFGTAV